MEKELLRDISKVVIRKRIETNFLFKTAERIECLDLTYCTRVAIYL